MIVVVTIVSTSLLSGTIVDYPRVPGGCDHAVLVTGYTPKYWIVSIQEISFFLIWSKSRCFGNCGFIVELNQR